MTDLNTIFIYVTNTHFFSFSHFFNQTNLTVHFQGPEVLACPV